MENEDGRFTVVNPRLVSSDACTGDNTETVINPALFRFEDKQTEVNPNAAPHTAPSREAAKNLGALVGGYRLLSVIAADSGEAELYVCENQSGQKFCLKHYRRINGVSPEIRGALQRISSNNIAKLLCWDYWDDRIYEVWPLFTGGTLSGLRPDENTLKKYIAQMNSALGLLHQSGMVHQDIKPANFMLSGEDIVLIDFGTCAMTGDSADRRTHVTQIGRTTDYAAPEVLLSNAFWPASDYYSLGITVYELLLGSTPYESYGDNMLQRKIDDMRYTKIPGLSRLSLEYQDLLTGLLQYDREKRWGYVQVSDWLGGNYKQWVIKSAAPGEKAFRFDGEEFRLPAQLPQLVLKMAYNWDRGQSLFDRDGRSSVLCRCFVDIPGAEELYACCNEPKSANDNSDTNYFRKLYRLMPELKLFTWRSWQFAGRKELGEAILSSLWQSEIDETTGREKLSDDIFGLTNFEGSGGNHLPSRPEIEHWARKHIISQYLNFTGEPELAAEISTLESTAPQSTLDCFRIAYALSGSAKLRIASREFSDVKGFLQFVERKAGESEAAGSIDSFLSFCRREIYDGQSVNAGFQAWLERMGAEKPLEILTGKSTASRISPRRSAASPPPPAALPSEAEKRTARCPKCGAALRRGAAQCTYCGERISQV